MRGFIMKYFGLSEKTARLFGLVLPTVVGFLLFVVQPFHGSGHRLPADHARD
jgi:predicted alpha/beta hydrolase